MLACHIDVRKEKIETFLAGSYVYEDMTDPDSQVKEIKGLLSLDGSLRLSAGLFLTEKTKITFSTNV